MDYTTVKSLPAIGIMIVAFQKIEFCYKEYGTSHFKNVKQEILQCSLFVRFYSI